MLTYVEIRPLSIPKGSSSTRQTRAISPENDCARWREIDYTCSHLASHVYRIPLIFSVFRFFGFHFENDLITVEAYHIVDRRQTSKVVPALKTHIVVFFKCVFNAGKRL